jgi:RND family efflux transporter MFP subunit
MARVASVAEGPVAALHTWEGQKVRAGAPLVIIGRRSGLDAAIGARREDLRKEKDNLRRTEQLVATDALPAEELDAARASYERASANLEGAEESGRDFTLRAPWRGTVSRVLVREGDFVSARSPVVELYDPGSLIVRAEVPERYAATATEGLVAAIRLDAFPGRELDGVIQRTYPYLDERMRTKSIEIMIREPVELLPGMFARIRLQLSTVPDAIVVPREAVISKGGSSVFVLESGTSRLRSVQTGIERDGFIQIISGVEEGETVIVAGHEKLQDGSPVRVAAPAGQLAGSARAGTRNGTVQ